MNSPDEPPPPDARPPEEPPPEYWPRDDHPRQSGWATFGKVLLILVAVVAGGVLLLFGTCLVMLR